MKKLDQQLLEQQFYVRSLIEANPDAVMITDPLGAISDVNERMIALTGRTRDELIGAFSRSLFVDNEPAAAATARALAQHRVGNTELGDTELTVRSVNGQKVVVVYNGAAFVNRDRTVAGIFVALRAKKEPKWARESTPNLTDEIDNAKQVKSEFLTKISHELRTPLNAIIGFSEALKDGLVGELTEEQRDYSGDIYTSGNRLLALITDILDVSKVEAGLAVLDLESTEVCSLLQESLIIVREGATATGVQLDFEVDDDLGIAHLDRAKSHQIVGNLLTNAVKFTAPGGRVGLRARRVPRSTVGTVPGTRPVHTIALAESAFTEFLEIRVDNDGVGIAPENMPKLFSPFSKIDSGLDRKFGGTGLGLPLVKLLAGLFGGTVAVSSAANEGSSFVVWLPLRGRSPLGSRQSTSAGAATDTSTGIGTEPGSQPRILPSAEPTQRPSRENGSELRPGEHLALVVEDDADSAELMRLLLVAEGFVVLLAGSGEEGLVLAQQHPLSLITLDLGLPGMDGWDFLGLLRQHKTLVSVPVVIIAGVANMSMALTHGAAAVLEKPITRARLRHSLAALGVHPESNQTKQFSSSTPTAKPSM